MGQVNLKTIARSRTGKGSARSTRREGRIPAVIYSHFSEAMPVALDPIELRKAVQASALKFNTVLTLEIDADNTKTALLKDWQVDPVSRKLLHADFLEIRMDEKLEADVPVELVGRPIGVFDGGVLSQIRREVRVRCLPGDIPVRIEADVTDLKIAQSLHVADIPTPENVEIVFARNFTIAVVSAPEAEVAPVPGTTEAAAAEVAPAATPAE